MASLPDCPSAAVLRAIALGRIQEPVLSLYLDHFESCEVCCAHVGAETALVASLFHSDDGLEPFESDHQRSTVPNEEHMKGWISRLKHTMPSGESARVMAAGEMIGPFRIVRALGEGGSAVVYEACDDELGRHVVLKVLHAVYEDFPERRAMVIEEARALAAMQHDAIMPLLQLVWWRNVPVLVFPRMPGETLATMLAAGGMTWRDALQIVRDVARGLGHAHSLGIFHHDVKPTNIWLHRPRGDEPPRALLFDFGLAGALLGASGTPGYAEPEPSLSADPQSQDLFSLGVVLHECLRKHGHVPPRCYALVRQLTAERASRRPSTKTVVDTIDRLLGIRSQRRSTIRIAMGVALIGIVFLMPVAGLLGGGVFMSSSPNGPIWQKSTVTSSGLPVGITSDANARAFVDSDSVLHIQEIVGDRQRAAVPLSFRPTWLKFSIGGMRIAAANSGGELVIIDVSENCVVYSHRFTEGISWIGWAGWERDAVAVLSNRQVYALTARRRKPRFQDVADQWNLEVIREGVVSMECFPNSDAMLAIDETGTLTSWSFSAMTTDVVVGPTRFFQPDNLNTPFGWKIPGVAFVVRDNRVFEIATLHGPEVKKHQLVAPARAIVWLTTTEYIALSEAKSTGGSRLVWGDVQRPQWDLQLDDKADDVERIQISDDHRTVIAITQLGEIRMYRLSR